MNLNSVQKSVIIVGALLLFCLALFPPWWEAAETEPNYRKEIGRGFILEPPKPVAVNCYFAGEKTAPSLQFGVLMSSDFLCITAPASHFYVQVYRKLLYSQLITVGGVVLALLWVLRSHVNDVGTNLGIRKTRWRFSTLIALVIPLDGAFPLAADLVDIPRQILGENLLLLPMILLLFGYALCVCVVFLLVSAVIKICAAFSGRQAHART